MDKNYCVNLFLDFAEKLKGKDIYLYPNIPPGKLKKAIKVYAGNVKEEEIFLLFDSTFFGTGSEGFCLTNEKLSWHDPYLGEKSSINISRIKNIKIIGEKFSSKIIFDNDTFTLRYVKDAELAAKCFADLIITLRDSQPEMKKSIPEKNDEDRKENTRDINNYVEMCPDSMKKSDENPVEKAESEEDLIHSGSGYLKTIVSLVIRLIISIVLSAIIFGIASANLNFPFEPFFFMGVIALMMLLPDFGE